MTQYPSQQPSYGERTLTGLVDKTAQEDPTKVFAVYPVKDNFASGSRSVTFSELGRAINRAAWWLEDTFGKAPESGQTIAYIGGTDIRYHIFLFGANKAGYTLLLPSPRNSVAFHSHIFKTAKCDVLIRDEDYNFDHVLTEHPEIKETVAPSLDILLSEDDSVPHYPYEENDAAFHKPWIVIHSSGSTGMPKCITWTHASLATMDRQHLLPLRHHNISQLEKVVPGTMFVGFPLFHAAGLLVTLGLGLYFDHTMAFPAPGQLKALTFVDALDNLKLASAMVPPAILEELTLMPQDVEKLSRISEIFTGGGPLNQARAEEASKYTNVYSQIGTSESAAFPILAHDPKDLGYFKYPTELKGLQFRESGDNLYELVFVRDPETDEYHSTWETFPDLKEYSTKDLYSQHPTKPGFFKYEGRNDDVLVLSNGEKVVAVALEAVLKAGKGVVEALVIGQGRFEVSALIELTKDAQELSKDQVLEDMQPEIRNGNRMMPKFAKLSPDRIIFTLPDKPMVRTPKGTVVRNQTLDLYKQEIEELYSASAAGDAEKYPLLNTPDLDTTVSSLIAIFAKIMDKQDLTKDTDVFVSGFDSLGVMNAVRNIKAILAIEKPDAAQAIIPSMIYSNPTMEQLGESIRALQHGAAESSVEAQRTQANAVLERFAKDLPQTKLPAPKPTDSDLTVVLTGSTGSLGAYMLDTLLASPKVKHVIALNRAVDGQKKQTHANASRKLTTDFKNRVTFLHADLSKPDLGISTKDYDAIKSSANIIIHNQWQVDFNLSLKSFEPHVAGVRHLIDLALASELQPYIIFTSTVSTVGNYFQVYPNQKQIPEEVFPDFGVPFPMGYGISKQIGERMLDVVSKQTGLRTAVARIGQVSGPVKRLGGVWNKQEWLPSLAVSSAHLKLLPEDIGCVDWTPVDTLAEGIVDISFHDVGSGSKVLDQAAVYNLCNPNWVPWSDMHEIMLKYLPAGTKVVPMTEWVEALKQSGEGGNADTVKNPALKLTEFFEGVAQGSEGVEMGKNLVIKNSPRNSKAMHDLTSIRPEWLANWLEGWGLSRHE